MTSAPEMKSIRRIILRWYALNGRPFPWRDTRDPYRVLVSEVMLQQTQADRVAARYPLFLKRFPDIRTLARAPRAAVLRAWQGMGYNNRAVRLHGAVREVVAGYNGSIPRDTGALAALPGIGRYTAHAVACFAHGRILPVVDVNVRRVLSRIFHRMTSTTDLIPESGAWELADRILPPDAYEWNQALMDFGSVICTARSPKCASCPVSGVCLSSALLREGTGRSSVRGRPRRPGIAAGAAREPSHLGIPRRIWRGKIVEVLRGRMKPVGVRELLAAVRASGRAPSEKWLNDLLVLLERDGVVALRRARGRTSVSLAR